MLKAIKTINGWILCGCCGHKLARITQESPEKKKVETTIEFKCASCKMLNEYDGSEN